MTTAEEIMHKEWGKCVEQHTTISLPTFEELKHGNDLDWVENSINAARKELLEHIVENINKYTYHVGDGVISTRETDIAELKNSIK